VTCWTELLTFVRPTKDTRNFFTSASKEFKQVIWIPGNHEHYDGNIIHTRGFIEDFLKHEGLTNVKYMDREVTEIQGYNIVAGTLWTNLKNRDPRVMMVAQDYMNDYRSVNNGPRVMIPRDTVEFHEAMLVLVKDVVAKGEKTIVVGHHSPSTMSIHPRYREPQYEPVNWAYSSDLSNLILDNPNIKLWVHGHVHDNFDYMIGSTRIACNPRGYIGYERQAETYKLQYIDV
jgi:3',5'-cyclic AMP phosphodiesterase CpdA